MLTAIRKFSNTIYAKIILGIMIIPFVLWGMGGAFSGGSKNTIATINKQKIPAIEYINYIRNSKINFGKMDKEEKLETFNKLLTNFIGEELMFLEAKSLGIKITDKSLASIIQNNDSFKKNNVFSRSKYEKHLIENSLTSISYEEYLRKSKMKELLFSYIGSGIKPPLFLVNDIYNSINQIREIEYVSLDQYYKSKNKITKLEIKNFYTKNKNNFLQTYKSINFIKITPKNLTNKNEFDEDFFKKLDEIDNMLFEENSLNNISNEYDLNINKSNLFDSKGKNLQGKKEITLNKNILKKINNLNIEDGVSLFIDKDEYIIVELNEVKNQTPDLNIDLEDKIKNILKIQRVLDTNRILFKKIKDNNFDKTKFNEFVNENNLEIKTVKIENINDKKIFDKEILQRLYKTPANSFEIISSNNFNQNFLIFVNNIVDKKITKNENEFNNYYLLSKYNIVNAIYGGYDQYLNKKYKVDINQQTFDRMINSF